MNRRDLGAANGIAAVEPGRCKCGHLAPLHQPGTRGRCQYRGCGCTSYRERPAGVVITFPGAGSTPAPAGPPTLTVDLDGVADRWTDLLDARHRLALSGQPEDAERVRLLEAACADDVPALREHIHRLTVALEARRG